MCLAVPGEIISVIEGHAIVDIIGLKQQINIQLIKDPKPGEHVLVHAGFAVEKIDKQNFRFLLDVIQEMLGDS